jgi:two-component system sensor histidine kinase UhpB
MPPGPASAIPTTAKPRTPVCQNPPMPAEPATAIRLLVVEDSDLDYDLMLALLLRERATLGAIRPQRVEDEAGLRAAFTQDRFDVLVSDHNLPRFDSLSALRVARELDPDIPVIVLSGEMSEELAVACLHAGADDFILKSRMFRLAPALRKSLDAAAARRGERAARDALAASEAQLRELTRHLAQVREDERRALAREVHDDIGSALTALRFELVRLARELGDRAPHERMQSMQSLLEHATSASHRIQHDLRPPVLDAGLVEALRWLTRSFAARGGPAATFETNRENVTLADDAAVAMYRVAQEALANIDKHAQARAVAVQLFCDDAEASLEIADDGNGFDAGMLSTTPGFGLRGLLERARGLGGWAEVASRPGAGTTVMFTLPLTAARPHDEDRSQ